MTTPTRPDCFEFAMSFLGDPEETELRSYIEALEARTALAQPEPVEPTDEDLRQFMSHDFQDDIKSASVALAGTNPRLSKSFQMLLTRAITDFARAVLARYGRNHG